MLMKGHPVCTYIFSILKISYLIKAVYLHSHPSFFSFISRNIVDRSRGGTEEDTKFVCSLATSTVVNLQGDAQMWKREILKRRYSKRVKNGER